MNSLRCAVVGVGYLGKFHAQKYGKVPHTQLAAVCDVNREQAEKIARELGSQAFTDPTDLIGKVDAVTVASTTKTHFELGKLFLENGIHVLMEKPIATTSEEGQALVEVAEKNGLVFK